VTLKSSDLLVLYTDGITEAENGTGQDLGRQQLSLNGHAKLQRILRERWEKTCLTRLALFRGRFRRDDETLLVLQSEEESFLFMLGEVANSYTFGRMMRSLKRE
jgi:serine phosphatase RsbU (regulator of sigma subunit)